MELHIKSSRSNGISLNRRSGIATDDGVNFENLIFLSVLLRLLEDDSVKSFHVAQNIAEVGAFDDLVFLVNYKPIDRGKLLTKLFLVQLKYRSKKSVTLDSLTAASGDGHFNLLKYYKDFKSMSNNVGRFNDVILNKCQIEDMIFVIYTNARCPIGDNNYPTDSMCRQLFETKGQATNIFRFNSSKRFEKFHLELKKNNSPIKLEEDGSIFLKQLVFISVQNSRFGVQEYLKSRLGKYYIEEDISLENILHRAIQFITKNNGMWLSRDSGVLHDIIFSFQGFPVKLNDMCKSFIRNTSFVTKIVVRHICKEKSSSVDIGKIVSPSKDYYIKRKLRGSGYAGENDDITYILSYPYSEQQFRDNINSSEEQFVLLCAGPGMGKSYFITHQAHLVKRFNKSKYVIRENLLDYSTYLNYINISENNNLLAENFLAEIAGVKLGTVDYDLFLHSLQGENQMAIFLDGMDEISPHYFEKVCVIIQIIRDNYRVQILVSTRPILQTKMMKYFKVGCWELKKFTKKDTKMFLQKYSGVENYNLDATENKLCGIPLFCKMLGDIIKIGDGNFSKPLSSKVDLYDKFIDVMYQKYHKEKEKKNVDIAIARNRMEKQKNMMLQNHENAAILALFTRNSVCYLKSNVIQECQHFLDELSQGFENIGLIDNIVDNYPIFIHRSIEEYFCGRWFARHTEEYKEFLEILHFYIEIDYFMSSKLNCLHPLFTIILNVKEKDNVENLLEQYIGEFNRLDPLGRNVLHYVKIAYNVHALQYILFNGFTLTKDIIEELLKLNDRISLRILTNALMQWMSAIFKRYHQYGDLIGLLLYEPGLKDFVPYLLQQHSRKSPLHMKILTQTKENISELIPENLNSRNDINLSTLHLAVWMNDVDTVKLLGKQGAEYSRDNVLGVYPHQFTSNLNYATEAEIQNVLKLFYGHFLEEDVLKSEIMAQNYDLQDLPLHNAAQKKKLENYFKSKSNQGLIRNWIMKFKNDVQSRKTDCKRRSAMHVAAANPSTNIDDVALLISQTNIKYAKDDNGYYPHHYAKDVIIKNLLQQYGFRFMFRRLPKEVQNIHGIEIRQVLNQINIDGWT